MPQFALKPTQWFKVNRQVRQKFNEAELRRLGESMKVKQLEPLIALADGTLICGERRLRAALLVGITHLEVKILDEEALTPSQIQIFQITENVQREDLTGPERWRGCEELLRLNPGWTNKELAEHLKLDASMITRLLSPSKTIAAVQDAFVAGKLGISEVYAISKAPHDQQAALLAAKLAGANRDELERFQRNGSTPAAASAKQNRYKISLSSGATVTVAGKELSLDGVIDTLQDVLKAAKKARDEALDAKTFVQVMRDKAKAGG